MQTLTPWPTGEIVTDARARRIPETRPTACLPTFTRTKQASLQGPCVAHAGALRRALAAVALRRFFVLPGTSAWDQASSSRIATLGHGVQRAPLNPSRVLHRPGGTARRAQRLKQVPSALWVPTVLVELMRRFSVKLKAAFTVQKGRHRRCLAFRALRGIGARDDAR